MTPLILTFTGKQVNPLDLLAEDLDIRDIAHALACCNRFAGHTKRPISVAQHSVYVSRLCKAQDAMQGLLHDASEAYLGDVTKWLKATPEFTAFREAEDRLQKLVYTRYGCRATMVSAVADADKLMLRFEGEVSFSGWPKWSSRWVGYPLLTLQERALIGAWKPWSWRIAQEAFLVQFKLLGGK